MAVNSDADPSCPIPILCVGLLCLDIVNVVDHYPEEDEDTGATAQQWRSGGNAANTSIVLSLIGRRCEFLGTLGHGMETDFAVAQLEKYGIAHHHCVCHRDCSLPTSCVTLNSETGSRTIIHFREGGEGHRPMLFMNLPELSAEDFCKIDLSQYSWIHFEGRCPGNYSRMIERVMSYRAERSGEEGGREGEGSGEGEGGMRVPGVSVELEKKGEDRVHLAPLADVIFLSKEYAQFRGYSTMEEAVVKFRASAKPEAVVVCAWGEKGAAATDSTGNLYTSPAWPPAQLRDTLGAGDTFNAGFVHKLSSGQSVEDALTFACRLAGSKCGMYGFEGLANTTLHIV